MKKQFIYNDKGKKVAIVVLLDEWNEMKKKLKKVKKINEKEKTDTSVVAKKVEAKKPNKVTPAVPVKKAAPKKAATVAIKK
jgi:hypothetical protein